MSIVVDKSEEPAPGFPIWMKKIKNMEISQVDVSKEGAAAAAGVGYKKSAIKSVMQQQQKNWSGLTTVTQRELNLAAGTHKKECLCSPTTHPGSFRCRLHRVSKVVKPVDHTAKNCYIKLKSDQRLAGVKQQPQQLSRFSRGSATADDIPNYSLDW